MRIAKLLGQFSVRLQETEFPNDVVQTEELIDEHEQGKEEVIEDLELTIHNGRVLRECFATDTTHHADLNGNGDEQKISTEVVLPLCRKAHITSIERWMIVCLHGPDYIIIMMSTAISLSCMHN